MEHFSRSMRARPDGGPDELARSLQIRDELAQSSAPEASRRAAPCYFHTGKLMKTEILTRLRALGTAARLEREAQLRARLHELERELAEVTQRVPFWARIVFFRESPDERRERELRASILVVRREVESA